jgi:DNA/RNA endonuclease YhcR with UshA esterase domain
MNHKFKILALSILILTFAASAFAQETVTPEDAAKFIGQQKTVCGTVASAHYATRTKGQPTFLNLNKPYPNQIFTVLIWGSDRSKFEKPPEALSGKEICVQGVIQSYKGGPEIIVKDPSKIKVK